jgi:hypothetical protein
MQDNQFRTLFRRHEYNPILTVNDSRAALFTSRRPAN